jgi:hypothetical protein
VTLGGLSPGVLADLVERYGSPHAALLAALDDPAYGPLLADAGVSPVDEYGLPVDEDAWEEPVAASVPSGNEQYVWGLLAAWAERGARPAAREANVVGSSRRKPIARGTLEMAVRLLANGGGQNEVARRTGLSTRVVRGLKADMECGALTWSESERLGLPVGTRTTRTGIVLPERR